MSTIIETNNLTKRYGPITAVNDVSLHVKQGEIYAFLGLNGAGKTTTIRMLLGMIEPTAGRASVLQTPVGTGFMKSGCPKPWHAVGYLVETPHAYPELSVRENLEATRRLRPGVARQAVDRVIGRLALEPYADRRAGTLSLGNAQRLGLAKALLHQPQLLILDEPANGLDPAGIVEIRKLLLDLVRNEGVTVFMSSHILGEVARLAHRIGIIHQGRLIQEVDVDELEHNRRRRLLIRTGDSRAGCAILAQAGLAPQFATDGAIEVLDETAIAHPDEVATCLVNAGHAPTMLNVEQEDLEQYFLRLVNIHGPGRPTIANGKW
ncbi:MAG: ABC transporter ATP-binding protein [Caldilineaceae bacterium]